MIDVFVEDINNTEFNVYFVHIGCVYKCKKESLEVLCNNVVEMYCNYNLLKLKEIEYMYLPITIYNGLYRRKSEMLFIGETDKNIQYSVRKVC